MAIAIAHELSSQVDLACSRFRDDSELMAHAHEFALGATPSPMLEALVSTALEAARLSDGMVDPTLGRHMMALGYDSAFNTSGSAALSIHTERSADWRDVVLRDHVLTIPAGVMLDLGATAKAYAADLIATACHDRAGAGVLVSLGGDIATAGEAPTQGWQILVQGESDAPSQQVTLAGGWSIATSSTRRRRWMRDDSPLHHILDPSTGMPAPDVWNSVSVVAPTCVEANLLSTAAIVAADGAVEWLTRRPQPRAARLVDQAGKSTILAGWPRD
jgi:thiamine biosynthesis lipoprotein